MEWPGQRISLENAISFLPARHLAFAGRSACVEQVTGVRDHLSVCHPFSRQSQIGFTLIELVIAIVLMGILAILIFQITYSNTVAKAQLASCAQRIKTEIRALQTQAKSTQLSTRVVFDTAANTYTTAQESAGNWSALKSDQDPGCVIVSTTLINDTLGFNLKGFAFESDGAPTPNVPLNTDRSLVLQAPASASEQLTLTLYRGTGLTE